MTLEQLRRAVLVCYVLSATLLIAARPISGQRNWHQGDTWLEWSHGDRESFVFGYVSGYSTGRWDGCGDGSKDSARQINSGDETDPIHQCRHRGPNFSKPTAYFISAITDLYKRYPEDRELEIGEVLEQLGNGLTIEDVHSHSFPRHSDPGGQPTPN